MQRGLYISGGAHSLLFLWVLVGNVFSSDPPQLQVADVTVLSEAEFAALTTPDPAPELAPVAPALPTPQPPAPTPEPATPAPEVAAPVDPEPQAPAAPAPAPPPPPRDTPPAVVPDAPPPQPDVADAPPDPIPAPEPDTGAPDISLRPQQRPAQRVAPEPIAPPPPDAVLDDTDQRAASPDVVSPDVAPDVQEETAPPATSTEIVTEADDPPASAAPTSSLRPKARPQRLATAQPADPAAPVDPAAPADAPPADAAPEEVADAPDDAATPRPSADDALAAALAEALSTPIAEPAAASAGRTGPPLTGGEQDAFRLAVQSCWRVDVGSQAANVTVTLGFELGRDGKVVAGTLRMLGSSGGSAAAVETAFQSARRAVLRCQLPDGYDLPEDKFDQWQNVEMVFNPADMRLR